MPSIEQQSANKNPAILPLRSFGEKREGMQYSAMVIDGVSMTIEKLSMQTEGKSYR